MKMYYFKTTRRNFGDELNIWLWPQLLPDYFDEDDSTLFLGIGSILHDFFPATSKKIVFGSGYGGYTSLPRIDASWRFHFVRGRLTAAILGIDQSLAVGDAAMLVRSCVEVGPQRKYPVSGKYSVSYMPHWQSAANGAWAEVCSLAGIHYIDPCGRVEEVLEEIMSSALVISESMHGAIVSDALRIPWIGVEPILAEHRMKWFDWASALGLTINFSKLDVSNAFELLLAMTRGNKKWAGRIGKRAKMARMLAPELFTHRAAESLSRIAKTTPTLSADRAIERAHESMIDKLEILRRGRRNV
jgi:hypothetical protein